MEGCISAGYAGDGVVRWSQDEISGLISPVCERAVSAGFHPNPQKGPPHYHLPSSQPEYVPLTILLGHILAYAP